MNNFDHMTQLLEQEASQKAEAILYEARQQAQRILQERRARAQQERKDILTDYRQRAKEITERVQSETRSELKHLYLQARQELIEEVLGQTRERYDRRGEAEEIELLTQVFWRSVERAGGERPVVLVPPERLAAARRALAQEAEVAPGEFGRGFVLSFKQFNVNYESDVLFGFRRGELEALAAVFLQGGEIDAKVEL